MRLDTKGMSMSAGCVAGERGTYMSVGRRGDDFEKNVTSEYAKNSHWHRVMANDDGDDNDDGGCILGVMGTYVWLS